jgi:micrococcal nuclease
MPPGAEVVTVASITDGDTLDVQFDDRSVFAVRVIGTNSPESGECFSDEATQVLTALAPVGSRVGMTRDVSDFDQFDRLLRYLWVGGMSVNEETVRRGAAISRSYPPDTAMALRLDDAQAAAQEAELGVWSPTACGPLAEATLSVADLNYDAPGDDNENLNEEWIAIRNDGAAPVDLTGWGIKDESARHPYSFPPSFTLLPERLLSSEPDAGPISTPTSTGAMRARRCGTTTATPPLSSIPTGTPTSPIPIRGDRRRRHSHIRFLAKHTGRPNCTDA